MSTPNQKKVVENLVKQKMSGELINKGKALKEAGYAKYVQKNPKQILESKGFQEAMQEYGLTEANFAKFLSADIEAKPANRLGELKLMAETLNLMKQNINLSVQKSDETMDIIENLLDGPDEAEEAS